jgi:diguanylate cyclase (GGDEF)-like protein
MRITARHNWLRTEVGANDYVGLVGDEFVIQLPDSSIDQIVGRAERTGQRVKKLTVAACNESGWLTIEGLPVVCGRRRVPTPWTGSRQLLTAADKALYEAKTDGRNQVRVGLFNSA